MGKSKSQYIAAYGFIRNPDNHFLLVQRAPHDSFPGMWELPGGQVEHNEDPQEATQREVLEEAGLDVTVGKALTTASGTSSKGFPVIRYAFLCEMNDPRQQVVLSEEHSAFQWITLEEKPDLYLSELVEHIFEKKEKVGH